MRCWVCRANRSLEIRYPTPHSEFTSHLLFVSFFYSPPGLPPLAAACPPHPYPAPDPAGRTRAPLPRSETLPSCQHSAFSSRSRGRRAACAEGAPPPPAAGMEAGMEAGMRAGKRVVRRGNRLLAAAGLCFSEGGFCCRWGRGRLQGTGIKRGRSRRGRGMHKGRKRARRSQADPLSAARWRPLAWKCCKESRR